MSPDGDARAPLNSGRTDRICGGVAIPAGPEAKAFVILLGGGRFSWRVSLRDLPAAQWQSGCAGVAFDAAPAPQKHRRSDGLSSSHPLPFQKNKNMQGYEAMFGRPFGDDLTLVLLVESRATRLRDELKVCPPKSQGVSTKVADVASQIGERSLLESRSADATNSSQSHVEETRMQNRDKRYEVEENAADVDDGIPRRRQLPT